MELILTRLQMFVFGLGISICLLLAPLRDARAEKQTVRIGWIGPLTGDTAFLGVDSAAVIKRELKKAAVNKRLPSDIRVELYFEDDQYSTAKTVAAYKKLVSVNHVSVIFVLTYGGLVAIAPEAERDGVLLIDPLDCDEQLAALPANTLCVAKNTEDMGRKNAEYAASHGTKNAAILFFDGDPFPQTVAAATKKTLEAQGARVSVFEGISQSTPDFRSLLTRVKAQGCDALFLYGYDSYGAALKQGRELGITAKYFSVASISSPGFRKAAGDAINGTIATGWSAPRTERYADFLKEHRADVGREPLLEVATVPTYDLINIILAFFERYSSTHETTPIVPALRSHLYGLQEYDGLSGKITMEPDGAVRSLPVTVQQFDGESFHPPTP